MLSRTCANTQQQTRRLLQGAAAAAATRVPAAAASYRNFSSITSKNVFSELEILGTKRAVAAVLSLDGNSLLASSPGRSSSKLFSNRKLLFSTAEHVDEEPSETKTPTRKRRTLIDDKNPIVLTDRSAVRIKELLATSVGSVGLRLGVKRRGCNGLSYTLNYATADTVKAGKDIAMESHGIKVFIEPMALFSVVGTVMDWEEGEMASEFTFNNPNSKGACGCGESFNV